MKTEISTLPVHKIGENIGIDLAAKFVKNYFDAYPDQAQSFIIGREIIEKVLTQPGCNGITIYPAIDESGKKTLVYAGVDAKGAAIVKIPVVTTEGQLSYEEGIVADRVRTQPYPDGAPNNYPDY